MRTSTRSHCGGEAKTDPYMTESVKTAPRRQTRRSRSRSPRVSRVAEKHRSRKSSRVKEEQSRGRLSSASVKGEKSRSPHVGRARLPSLPSLRVSASIKGSERPSGEVPLTKVKQRSTEEKRSTEKRRSTEKQRSREMSMPERNAAAYEGLTKWQPTSKGCETKARVASRVGSMAADKDWWHGTRIDGRWLVNPRHKDEPEETGEPAPMGTQPKAAAVAITQRCPGPFVVSVFDPK